MTTHWFYSGPSPQDLAELLKDVVGKRARVRTLYRDPTSSKDELEEETFEAKFLGVFPLAPGTEGILVGAAHRWAFYFHRDGGSYRAVPFHDCVEFDLAENAA